VLSVIMLISQLSPSKRSASDKYSKEEFAEIHNIRDRLPNNNESYCRLLAVLGMVHFNPHINIRQIECKLGIPRFTAHRMLQSVQYHPYQLNTEIE